MNLSSCLSHENRGTQGMGLIEIVALGRSHAAASAARGEKTSPGISQALDRALGTTGRR